jgi:hypothetical protein
VIGVLRSYSLGAHDLAVGIDEGLLVDAAHALHVADVEGVLCQENRRTRKAINRESIRAYVQNI